MSLACLDNGDGAARRLLASEEPRAGTANFCSVRGTAAEAFAGSVDAVWAGPSLPCGCNDTGRMVVGVEVALVP